MPMYGVTENLTFINPLATDNTLEYGLYWADAITIALEVYYKERIYNILYYIDKKECEPSEDITVHEYSCL